MALDMAQARKMKRRDNALRQIERWRAGLGGKAKVLSDKFISEQALAERYGGAHVAGANTDDRVPEATEPVPTVAPDQVVAPSDLAGEAVQTATRASMDLSGEPEKAAPPVAPADPMAQSASAADPANAVQAEPTNNPANAAEAASLPAGTREPALAHTDDALGAAPPPAPAKQVAQAAPTASGPNGHAAPPPPAEQVAQTAPTASGANGRATPPLAAREIAQAATERGLRNDAADTATSRTSNEVEAEVGGVTERINWVAWLTGAKRYNWCFLSKAGEQAFERLFPSKRELVRHAVFDRKIIRPDEVCPALAPWLQGPELPSPLLFGVARGEARQ
jgi:hypothetical protein